MPGMDGIDILRWVKENNRHEEVIIITAFGSLESAIDALSRGVFDYITKPFKKEQIILTIDRAMRWQKIKMEAGRVSTIFDCEPYTEALENFKREYILRLSQKCDGAESEIIRRSGLTKEEIESATANQSGDGAQ
jgi:DNA-binding NtrC family response regulator